MHKKKLNTTQTQKKSRTSVMNTKQLLETTRALGAQFSTKRKNAQNMAKLSNRQ
jgi:hypothetical protein